MLKSEDRLELSKFKKLVNKVSCLIESYEIKVKSYSEMAEDNLVSKKFMTNHGLIEVDSKYDEVIKDWLFTIICESEESTIRSRIIPDNEGIERMFDDIGNDLRSLFYDTHLDLEGPDYEDMSGDN